MSPESHRQWLMRSRTSGGSAAGANILRYSSFGFRLEITAAARSVSPASADDADRTLAFHQHFAHRRGEADVHATLARRLCHRLSDGAHAADGMPPGAVLAVHLAEHMMQQLIRGAGA